MSFPQSIKEDALLLSGRHCCLCHRFCGLKIELHHIVHKAAGGEDTLDNCIALCFDCHADMRSYDAKHPKGTKYTDSELKRHRDSWYVRVKGTPVPSYTESSLHLDRGVFLKTIELLPYKSMVEVLEHHDFGAPFRSDIFSKMDRFVLRSEDPELEFIDADLEGMRSALVSGIAKFANTLATRTWSIGDGVQCVNKDWDSGNHQKIFAVIEELNSASSAVAVQYKDFVRNGRRRLGVSSADEKSSP